MKSKIIFILALAAMVVLAIAIVQGQNYWPMFNRDLLNTGVADPSLTGIMNPIEMWDYTTDNLIGPGSPVIGDIDNDGVPEILVPTANFSGTGGIYALNSDGSLKWKYQTGDYGTYATPSLADIDDDGKLETIFPSYGGIIVAVDDDGIQMWVVDKGWGGTQSAIADINGDEALEVVAGAAGKIWLLNASNGAEIWSADYSFRGSAPAIADIDGDDEMEIVFSNWTNVVALNGEDGSVLWSAGSGQFQGTCAILRDINGDGKPEVAVGNRYPMALYVFSGADGTELWNYAVVGRCFSAAVADFTGDDYDDVVTTATKGDGVESYVYLLDVKEQTLVWQHNVFGAKYHSTAPGPALADVNGDGTLDVIVDNGNRVLYVLSGIDGSEIWTIARTAGGQDASSPAIGDLDGDCGMEIVVAAGNSVQVFTNIIEVSIDIMPGSDQNTINLSSAGVIPVAILSSDTFDATTVDPETVSLAGAAVKMAGKSGKYLSQERDVNKDGLLDLVCEVLTEEFFIESGQSVAELTAKTYSCQPIRGEDIVRIVPDE